MLSLGTSNHLTLSIFFIAAYLLWAFGLLRPQNWLELIGMLLVLVSPPSLLLIERANDDIIIYAFIMTVPLLLKTNRTTSKALGWLVISLLTPIKYYPAAAYALFLHRTRGLKEFLCYVSISIVFGSALLWMIWDELTGVAERIPSPPANCAFGGTLLLEALDIEGRMQPLLFCAAIMLIGLLAIVFTLHPKIKKTQTDSQNELYFLLGSSVLTFCFLLNGNWDYRLAFLIPTLPLTFELLRNEHRLSRLLATSYLISMFITLWIEYLYFFNAMDLVKERWVIAETGYTRTQLTKHVASWLMIISNILIATLILKNDVLRLMAESITLIKKPKNAET